MRLSALKTLALPLAACLASPPMFAAADPTRDEVQAAMRKAADFMMDSMSYRGGFVWKISIDGTLRYGELKARDTMIWVEPPGTPTVGLVFLEAYKETNDERYLEYADKAARALIWGQRPAGGWHYFIDFDAPTLPQYYEDYFSRRWGWEEHTKQHDNATFDDQTTSEATTFLLRLYDTTMDPAYRAPLLKALDMIVTAQYPNGAWPQRFPLEQNYTAFYTFNDEAAANNIHLLLEAAETLGNPEYEAAARRGMDFFILSQLPTPQAGWAQQYDFTMQPAPGRKFEIGTINAGETWDNMKELLKFYQYTGDRRYLEPIPKALDWLETARIPPDGRYTYFYEMGSNRPIYSYAPVVENHKATFGLTYNVDEAYPYGLRFTLNLGGFRSEFDRFASLDPSDARDEYDAERAKTFTTPNLYRKTSKVDYRTVATGPDEIAEIIAELGHDGAWVHEDVLLDETHFIDNPAWDFVGYDTGTYVARLYRMINYLRALD